MDKIIVYLDDAAHALAQLAPMENGGNGGNGNGASIGSNSRVGEDAGADPEVSGSAANSTLWILVACPPRITKYISRWVTHSARNNWRLKWSEEQFSKIAPTLQARGGAVTTHVARGPLVEQTASLLAVHPTARVLDARLPRLGQDMEPVTRNQPVQYDRWSLPGAVAGMGALLVLASD